jgi:probable F420-dependent oxidoreductase
MKLDLSLVQATVAEMPQRVHQARAAGFDGVFVAETQHDPFLPLAAARATAHGMDLGTCIALAFPRSPMSMAISAWEMQRDHGQFILGLGAQVRKHIERRFSCTYDRPAARLDEYVRAVRHIWAAFQGEHRLDFQGEFYHLDFLPELANPGPLEGLPPLIYLAAVGPRMYRTAGAVTDGAFIHPHHTVSYLQDVAIPAVAEGRRNRTDAAPPFSLSASVFTIVGTGPEATAMDQAVRRQLAFYASTPTYRDVLRHSGWETVGDELHTLVKSGNHAALPTVVPDAMMDDFCIRAETWAEAAHQLRERYTGVADRVAFYHPPPADVPIR